VFVPLVVVLLVSPSPVVLGCWRPVAVALDGDRLWPEHLDPVGGDNPSEPMPPHQRAFVQFQVLLSEPAEDPPEAEVVHKT